MRFLRVQLLFACCLTLPMPAPAQTSGQLMPRDYRGVQTNSRRHLRHAHSQLSLHRRRRDRLARSNAGRQRARRHHDEPHRANIIGSHLQRTPRAPPRRSPGHTNAALCPHLRSLQPAKHHGQSQACIWRARLRCARRSRLRQHRCLRSNSRSCPASPKPISDRNR